MNTPYSGNLIESLISTVESAQTKQPLTVDEVLERSAMVETANPYEKMIRSAGARWM